MQNRPRIRGWWIVWVILLGRGGVAHAGLPVQTCGATLGASRDSSLRESSPTVPLGLDSTLYLGIDGCGESRLIVSFNLRGDLAPGATIQSATLELTSTDTGVPSTAIEVRGLDEHWREDSATWDMPPPLGDSYGPRTVVSSTALLRIDVTTLVARALVAPGARGGVDLALLPASTGAFLRTFHSREDAPADLGARLVVRCANPVEAPARDESAADQRQIAAVQRLR
jgi:hypothetical protein